MHKKKVFHYKRCYIAIFLVLLVICLVLGSAHGAARKEKKLNTIVTACVPEEETDAGNTAVTSDQKVSQLMEQKNYALTLQVQAKKGVDEDQGEVKYALVEADLEEFKKLNREDFHDFIDEISSLSYDYYTVSFGDGTGLVFHPKYAYWSMYGTLDEQYNIKKLISYVDASNDQIERVSLEKDDQVQKFIEKITEKYKDDKWYKVETKFLYDNIFEVKIRINIKTNTLESAKKAIRDIEQKADNGEYRLNFEVTCVDEGKEVITMYFGEEHGQYVYVENGHRVTLDTIEY